MGTSRGRRSQTVGADCLSVCHPRDVRAGRWSCTVVLEQTDSHEGSDEKPAAAQAWVPHCREV